MTAAHRFKLNKQVLTAYCEEGLQLARMTGDTKTFEDAVAEMKAAEQKTGDSDISRRIARLEHRMLLLAIPGPDAMDVDPDDD